MWEAVRLYRQVRFVCMGWPDGNQRQSDGTDGWHASRGNQRQSEAIRGNQSGRGGMRGLSACLQLLAVPA